MKHARLFLILFITLAAGLAAVSNDSLWMDEGKRMVHACYGTWEMLWRGMGQDMQPLFYLQEWAWGNAFSFTDFIMRGMNLPFLLIGAVYLCALLRRAGISPWWALLLPLHPMTCYYMNDVSPYIILQACTLGMLYHGFFAERHRWGNIAALNAWFALAYAYHFIAGFMGLIYACSLLLDLLRRRAETPWRRHIITGLCFCVVYIPLTCFYLLHMHNGDGQGWESPGAANAGYVLYALLGFQGLGLSRNALRAHDFTGLTPAMIAALAGYALTLAASALLNLKQLLLLLRQRYVLCMGLYALVFAAASFVMKFQFWERHFMPLLAGAVVLEAQLLHALWQSAGAKRWLNRALIALLLAGQLLSCAQLRCNPYHGKDDYKGVLTELKQQDGLVLMQGTLAVWVCYGTEWASVGQYIQSPLQVKDGAYLTLAGLDGRQVTDVTAYLLRRHRSLRLVLDAKEMTTPGLFDSAAETLRRQGFTVQVNDKHRNFRILTVSAPQRLYSSPW